MGVLFSRFKKKRTPLQILEQIESKISSIEILRHHTEHRQKKIIGHLILYSVTIYIVAAAIFYFYFFPASLRDRIFYIIPLLIFPIIVIILKRLVLWYYRHQIANSEDKLLDLKEEKKKVLDTVMEKETFKVAKEILEKFAPDQLRKITPVAVPANIKVQPNEPLPSLPLVKGTMPGRGPIAPSKSTQVIPLLRSNTMNGEHVPQRVQLTRPILPKERTSIDKLVDYLVGDGPSNRYALICKDCSAHNGMALKEEFLFIAFRCCYCGSMNSARQRRPQAPRLNQAPHINANCTTNANLRITELPSGTDDNKEQVGENVANNEINLQNGEGNNPTNFRSFDEEMEINEGQQDGIEKTDDSPEKSDAEKKED